MSRGDLDIIPHIKKKGVKVNPLFVIKDDNRHYISGLLSRLEKGGSK